MGTEREGRQRAERSAAPARAAPAPKRVDEFLLSLRTLAGNAAIQRRLKGQLSLTATPEELDAFRTSLIGAWREYAEAGLRPENVPGIPMFVLPAGMLPGGDEPETRRRSDEFIVSRDAFGLTIIHPDSDSRVRVVATNYRYAPEQRGGNVPTPQPGEVPAMSYNLIAPSDTTAAQVLIATGPGAFVDMDEPVPYEGAREENLQEEWEHGGRPARLGNFDLTVVEVPDNSLVPLPGESIDVATLLAVGGRFHTPDRRTWRGAVTYQERVLAIGMMIGQLAMIGIPLAFELIEAVALARAAAALAEADIIATEALETAASRLTTAAVTEEIPAASGETAEAALPSVAVEAPPIPVVEPVPPGQPQLAAELDAAFEAMGGQARGYTIQLVNDQTVVPLGESGYSNAGIAAKRAGGAVTDVPRRIVWVHQSVVEANGVTRSWGARLNLRQVIAHEMGHGEAGSWDCCMASRTGADFPELSEAERAGLLEDAARIAPREGVSVEQLDLPPGFRLPPT